MTLSPTTGRDPHAVGLGAVAEPRHPYQDITTQLVQRATRSDYHTWLNHIMPAAACSHPVRLRLEAEWHPRNGSRSDIERPTDAMPDGQIYVACKNRRASVCPACAETYRQDTYHLVKAGLLGGKGVPETVAEHPCMFVTFSAPSFGPVHSPSPEGDRICRPRRAAQSCPHGVNLACWARHTPDDPQAGEPLCKDCYDYTHQAAWNLHTGELWRRTTQAINRTLARAAKRYDTLVRVSYAKVAEYQHRGVIHFHALIRLDGHDPQNPDDVFPPLPALTSTELRNAILAAGATQFTTAPHPRNRDGWPITWGEQLDCRTVTLTGADIDDRGGLSNTAVAGYLAKYATKATEDTGHVSRPLTDKSLELYTQHDTHQARQLQACWYLGQYPLSCTTTEQRDEWDNGTGNKPGWGKLRKWAHMLGYGGHFSTKSRRYSTTLGALRAVRKAYQAGRNPEALSTSCADEDSAATEAVVTLSWLFNGTGWLTTADAALANTAAAKARERQQTAREESEETLAG
ncbi:hypothetical protein EV191_11286 [Tamaricihabitans halophyticus]|uniref:Replication initiator protein n=2 Tax=Tamaricihabitans halophyticus TaxID=1262583 RepID=A0A4R2QDZ1_9PSEU|nr:hypothetical protein EV191_11286 [Tamaricihabitans halophyticus]